MFGSALSFKLQAIFFLPIIVIYTKENLDYIKSSLLIPSVVLLSMLPAIFVGK